MTFNRIHLGLHEGAQGVSGVMRRSRAVPITVLALIALLGAIAAFRPGWLVWFDSPIADWIRGIEGDLSVAKLVTQLGSPSLTISLGLVVVVVIWRRCRASALTLGALVTAALVTDVFIKLLVQRSRPPGSAVDTQLGSFPSGHTIHATVIFGLVPLLAWLLTNRRLFVRLGFVLFATVAVAVAISRVRLGAHWPSDVIGSLLIGVALLFGAESIITSQWSAQRCSALGYHQSGPLP